MATVTSRHAVSRSVRENGETKSISAVVAKESRPSITCRGDGAISDAQHYGQQHERIAEQKKQERMNKKTPSLPLLNLETTRNMNNSGESMRLQTKNDQNRLGLRGTQMVKCIHQPDSIENKHADAFISTKMSLQNELKNDIILSRQLEGPAETSGSSRQNVHRVPATGRMKSPQKGSLRWEPRIRELPESADKSGTATATENTAKRYLTPVDGSAKVSRSSKTNTSRSNEGHARSFGQFSVCEERQLALLQTSQPGAERVPGIVSRGSQQDTLMYDQASQPPASTRLTDDHYDVEHRVPEAEIVQTPPLATAVEADDAPDPKRHRWVAAGVLLALVGLITGLIIMALAVGSDSGDKSSNFTGTLQMLAPGGENHYKDFLTDRFRRRVEAFKEKTGVDVQINTVGDIDKVNEEIIRDLQAQVYDGYIFLPFITATLVEENGLADLTEFVRDSEDVDWLDVLGYNRDIQAVYNKDVRLIPCDGDIHSLFYRKDLFELYNVQVPRTWDEYDEVAAFFHGMSIPKDDGSGENVTLVGSCITRRPVCHEDYFFSILVHSSITQTRGTKHGALFDPTNFKPLLGEAMAETLRHLEIHVKFGAEDEFTSEECGGLNIRLMNEGRCAMTYMWGDSFARHMMEGSTVGGKLGVAPTPGSTVVLDRSTGKLVNCTEEICPHGETFPHIGRVNRAPYAAAGGWSTGVSANVSPDRIKAMAEFFGFVCGKEESIEDVIVNATGSLVTGADPYRSSHLNVTKWVEKGYPRDSTIDYLTTVKNSYESENIVLDLRVNKALEFQTDMQGDIFLHLNESRSKNKSHSDRMAVANKIEALWKNITEKFNALHSNTGRTLLTIYRRSLNLPV